MESNRVGIVQYPDPVLLKPCVEVEKFDSELQDIAHLIDKALHGVEGLAVAANQVGVGIRMFGYYFDPHHIVAGSTTHFIVNPRIVEGSQEQWTFREFCLSLPGMRWYIMRPRHIMVTGYSLKGEKVTLHERDLKGRMFQHELDHLAGRVILDRITPRERKIALRQLDRVSGGTHGPGRPSG